jgi:hypothetical protein
VDPGANPGVGIVPSLTIPNNPYKLLGRAGPFRGVATGLAEEAERP